MSEMNRTIYLRYLNKQLDTLLSWSSQLRRNGNLKYAAEMDRQADNVRRSMSMVGSL